MKKKTKVKKRKPTDATLRNVGAANKRIARLEKQVEVLLDLVLELAVPFSRAGAFQTIWDREFNWK